MPDNSLPSAVFNFRILILEISISPFSLFQTGCVSTQKSPWRVGNLLIHTPHSSIFCRSLLYLVVGLSSRIVNFSFGNFLTTKISMTVLGILRLIATASEEKSAMNNTIMSFFIMVFCNLIIVLKKLIVQFK